jgi:hypothetical protein
MLQLLVALVPTSSNVVNPKVSSVLSLLLLVVNSAALVSSSARICTRLPVLLLELLLRWEFLVWLAFLLDIRLQSQRFLPLRVLKLHPVNSVWSPSMPNVVSSRIPTTALSSIKHQLELPVSVATPKPMVELFL